MTDLELLEQHLTQDLEQRREGGEKCPFCGGTGRRNQGTAGGWIIGGATCRECLGSGRSPYITAAEEALAAVQRVREERRWRPLSERPPDGEVLLLLVPGSCVATDRPGVWNATHWMPLPEAPKPVTTEERKPE